MPHDPKVEQWALYAKQESGRIPQGERCQSCYLLWKEAFGFLTWEEMVQRAAASSGFAQVIQTARLVKAGEKEVGVNPQQVSQVHDFSLEVERAFTLVTEKEMRRWSGLSRIPKALLRNHPSLNVPCEDNPSEE